MITATQEITETEDNSQKSSRPFVKNIREREENKAAAAKHKPRVLKLTFIIELLEFLQQALV